MGVVNVTPGLVLRRRAVPRPRAGHRARPRTDRRGRRRHRRRRRVDPARRRRRRRSTRSCGGCVPVVEALAPHVARVDRHPQGRGGRGGHRGGRHAGERRLGVAPRGRRRGRPAVGFVAMHMHGDPRTMQANPAYDDVVRRGARLPRRAGRRGRWPPGVEEVWIDPGIGFGKTAAHNLSLLAASRRAGRHRLAGRGRHQPEAISRRSSWPSVRSAATPEPVGSDDRVEGSVATAVWAMVQGARMVRVHDVRATVHAARVVAG